ncbi:MAG TPA: DNA starvation/stationary phase protection protein [Galbitalea sp.]|jgi:starvation-inducible DNA-binding protein|nr:DNA starvation/stationary phase protection protein [Galbitalea sp.]
MTAVHETRPSATTTQGPLPTQRENAEHGFVASATLTDDLQAVLVDLIELHLQGKQAHWNVVGRNFRDLHLQLDELVDGAREFSDAAAERLRALHASVDGRSTTVASTTSLEPFPDGELDTASVVDLVTARIDRVVATAREVHDEVDSEDPTSADLLHDIIARLEQLSWMFSAENRVPGSRRK